MAGSEDLALVLAAKTDPREFAALYRKYYPAVYRFCYYRVNRHKETTEDIVSDTFIKALDNIEKYQDKGAPFIVWLYTIARNLITDYYRSGRVRMEGSSAPLDWTGTDESVSQDAEERDLKSQLTELIPTLPDEDQELLALRFTSELGFNELGKVLGISEGAAKMRYTRIVEKLKVKINLPEEAAPEKRPDGTTKKQNKNVKSSPIKPAAP